MQKQGEVGECGHPQGLPLLPKLASAFLGFKGFISSDLKPNPTRRSLVCPDNQCIEQSKLYGMKLALGKLPAILSWSHFHKAFEGSGKMTLVGKPSRRSDGCQRSIGLTKLVAGVFDAKLTNVLSDGTTTKPAESAGQMNRVYAD